MEKKAPEGIGGWLLIPTFAFVVTAILFIYISSWFIVDITKNGYDELVFFMFVIFSFMSCFYVYALILEFKKKKSFPKVAISCMLVSYFLLLLMEFLFDGVVNNFYGLIGVVLWVWYLIKSKRVRRTFIN